MSNVSDLQGMMDGLNNLAHDALSVDPSEAEWLGAAAIDRIAELEAVVREVEWGGVILDGDGEMVAACPLCDGPHAIGHAPGCRLAAVTTPTAAREAGEGGSEC